MFIGRGGHGDVRYIGPAAGAALMLDWIGVHGDPTAVSDIFQAARFSGMLALRTFVPPAPPSHHILICFACFLNGEIARSAIEGI